MCLKQIPQPNNKDGDSCCFKSTAAQRRGSAWQRKGMLAFQQTEADSSGLYGRIKYNMGED